MPAPQPKTIDIQSGKIQVGDRTGYIQPVLSTIRYVEYLKRVPRLTYHTTFAGMYDTLSKIYMATSAGNDMIYAVSQARELSWNQLDAIKRFDENEIPDIIDFCCLFINFDGEDVSKFDHAAHEAKKLAVHQEGYDVSSFFSLAFNLIENLPDAYRKIKSYAKGTEASGLTMEQHTQPIDVIS